MNTQKIELPKKICRSTICNSPSKKGIEFYITRSMDESELSQTELSPAHFQMQSVHICYKCFHFNFYLLGV